LVERFGRFVFWGGDIKVSGEEFVEKAEVISAVRDYETVDTRRKDRMVDFTVSPSESDDRILMRVITEGSSKAGYVTVDNVKELVEVLEARDYEEGILIGKRFTKAAKREMTREDIEMVSERILPRFKSERLHSVINGCVMDLCKAKCGDVPMKESDCKGYVDGHYSCDVRLVSDNASFHFELGWDGFLERDLARLLAIGKSLKT
jgi:hypothetical protein